MPIHVDELTNDEPFPIKPGTNEYEALSFLVANHQYGFTPAEIATNTTVSSTSASKTMARLYKKGFAERSAGAYYVAPDRVETVRKRLDSLDSAVQLFASTADDDGYGTANWDEELPSLDPTDESNPTAPHDQQPTDEAVDDLIAESIDESDQPE